MSSGSSDLARAKFQQALPGLCNWLWSRTRVIDAELYSALTSSADQAPRQLVVLGAGFDTRCYRFRQVLAQQRVECFEVDLPSLQASKRAAMQEVARREGGDIGLERVNFVPLDLSRPKDELLAVMRDHGFKSDLVSIFIWEGVTAYLTPEAVQSSLEFMHDGSARGSLLLATFLTPTNQNMAGAKQMDAELKRKKEPHVFHPTVAEFQAVLEKTGWNTVKMFTPKRLQEEYSTPEEGAAWPGAHIVLARRM
jgi:methyltransferase (TIGR00027 family)